jgi:diguanylate cyclase (GGDEF)-like protein
MLDMDGLKKINDTRGHSAGDEAVQAVAAVLMHLTRRSDTVARLGGDEFAVLLDGCPAGTAVTLVERILRAMARQRISGGEALAVSIGIASYPEDGQTAQELEKAADDALYLAKGRGGKQFAVHQETLRGG